MNPVVTQQVTLDNSLVAPEKRLKIERSSILDIVNLYMHQFWNTVNKIGYSNAYNFKLDKKKCRVDTEVFREIRQICPKHPNHEFDDLPSKEELVSFIKELDYTGKCEMLSAIHTDQMHQPWRTFVAIINREISSARKEHMPYPRFTQVIINHFISKDNTISMRNKINLHIARDDSLLDTTSVYVSKKKAPAKANRGKGTELLVDVALLKDAQLKKEVLDEPTGKTKDTSEGIGVKPRVLDVSKAVSSDSVDVSKERERDERTYSDDDENPFFTLKDYEEEEQEDEYMHTLEKDKSDDEEKINEEEDDDVTKELYEDLNINWEDKDADMFNAE
nr:hypothetical protein [Tanacetum cinerariifolium]